MRDRRQARGRERALSREVGASARLRSRSCSRGDRNDPSSASASSAPFPDRVGMSETTDAPAAQCRRRRSAAATRPVRRPARTAARRAGTPAARRRATRGDAAARTEPVDGHPLVKPLERAGVRRLEPHRDFERRRAALMTPQRVEEPASSARRPATGCDSTMMRGKPARLGRDRVVVVLGHRARIEEAAGVVQLHLTDALARLVQASCAPRPPAPRSRPRGVSLSVVCCQRSHITQRHGHSRPVRNTVATRAIVPSAARSSSTRRPWARHGSCAAAAAGARGRSDLGRQGSPGRETCGDQEFRTGDQEAGGPLLTSWPS